MTEQEKQRLRWSCRRGMLELDLILSSFFEHQFDQLKSNEQAAFCHLLECDDQDLIAWFMGYSVPQPVFCHIITIINNYVKNKHRN